MNLRNKLFRKYCRSKDQSMKCKVYGEYQTLRNKVIYLTKKSKSEYYKTYFLSNKNDIAKTWQGIKQLVSSNKTKSNSKTITISDNGNNVTDLNHIVNIFNNYFVNVGPKIAKNIPAFKNELSTYSKHVNIH